MHGIPFFLVDLNMANGSSLSGFLKFLHRQNNFALLVMFFFWYCRSTAHRPIYRNSITNTFEIRHQQSSISMRLTQIIFVNMPSCL